MIETRYTLLLGRILIGAIFVPSGLSKLAGPAATKAYIAAAGLPLPDVAFGMAVLVEIVGGLAFVLGFHTRLVALGLAAFTLVTALVFHNHLSDQAQLINFLKNLAITGGLLHVAVTGGGALSLDGRAGREGFFTRFFR